MKSENTSWNKVGVWICNKCIKNSDFAESLKAEWKLKIKDQGRSAEIRVMTSSCLNSCPVDQQAILVIEKNGPQKIITCDPTENSKKTLLSML